MLFTTAVYYSCCAACTIRGHTISMGDFVGWNCAICAIALQKIIAINYARNATFAVTFHRYFKVPKILGRTFN